MSSVDENEENDEGSSLEKSLYSVSFKIIRFYGAWNIDSNNGMILILFKLHQAFMMSLAAFFISLFFWDFYNVYGNVKQMAWNICVSSLFTGACVKLFLIWRKSDVVNDLRRDLHEKMKSRRDEKDREIEEAVKAHFKTCKKYLYTSAISFGTIWQVNRYTSRWTEEKLMPIPFAIPFEIDLNDGRNFDLVFVTLSFIAAGGLFLIIEMEMAMISILLQIKREYDILLKDISNLDKTSKSNGHLTEMINSHRLSDAKVKIMLKDYCYRQRTVMRYAKTFEFCYNVAMVPQVIIIIILCVAIGLQCILVSDQLTSELFYQIGYLSILLSYLYYLCFTCSTLEEQCRRVGSLLHESEWYLMDSNIRKDLILMILISQHPPRITSMQMVDINLPTFMWILKNIYSWLALFRQTTLKTNNS